MKLTVIIVNYNVKELVEQCLQSVMRAAERVTTEVIVVDNNSSDGSVEYLRTRFQNVKFIENEKNIGFSRANNIAIKESTGEYVLLLNPDTFTGEHLFEEVIEFMDSNDGVGGVGVKMLNADGSFAKESRRGVPTPFTAFCKMSGLSRLFPKNKTLGHYYLSYLPVDERVEIEIISGACMFLRKKALDEVGLLDETFFMYGEDIDLSYRLLKAGWKNYYVPSMIVHYKGESTKHNSYSYVNAFYRAMAIFFSKHFSSKSDFGLSSLVSRLSSWVIYMAIYLKAVIDFLFQNIKKLLDTKQSQYYISKRKVLVIAEEKNIPIIIKKLQAMKMQISSKVVDDDILRNGQLAEEILQTHYDYVVYDMNVYQFDDVLSIMEKAGNQKKAPRVYTFS